MHEVLSFAFFERKADVMYYHEIQIANVQEACEMRFETPSVKLRQCYMKLVAIILAIGDVFNLNL